MKTPKKQKYAKTRRTNLRLTEHRVTFLLKNRAAASIAARTDVSPASMNQFHDYFPKLSQSSNLSNLRMHVTTCSDNVVVLCNIYVTIAGQSFVLSLHECMIEL